MVLVGPRLLACALLLVLASVPASGSLLEDASGGLVSYQFDAGNHHDAPDACEGSDPAWSFDAGEATDGLLVPPDDNSDVFQLNVTPDLVGKRLVVSLTEDLANAGPTPLDLLLDVLAPLCDGDVFAPENQPYVLDPPAPAAGEAQTSLPRGSTPQTCSDAWTFAVGGLGNGAAPASLYVAWTDGVTQTIPLANAADGEAYYGPVPSIVRLEGVWVNMREGWNGPLKVLTGVCDAPDGGAVYGEPPVLGNDWIGFTPVRAGPHEVVVSVAPPTAGVPGSVPLSCHWCAPQVGTLVEKVSYRVVAREQA